jgi:hypothetical protein
MNKLPFTLWLADHASSPNFIHEERSIAEAELGLSADELDAESDLTDAEFFAKHFGTDHPLAAAQHDAHVDAYNEAEAFLGWAHNFNDASMTCSCGAGPFEAHR